MGNLGAEAFKWSNDPQDDTPTIERCTDCGCAFDSDELVGGLCVECDPVLTFHHTVTPEEDADLEEWLNSEREYVEDCVDTVRIQLDRIAADDAALIEEEL